MQALFSGRTCPLFQLMSLLGVLEFTLQTQQEDNIRLLLDFLFSAVTQCPSLIGPVSELCSNASLFPSSLHPTVLSLFSKMLRQLQDYDHSSKSFGFGHTLSCLSLFIRECTPTVCNSCQADPFLQQLLTHYYAAYDVSSIIPSQGSSSSSSSTASQSPAAAATVSATAEARSVDNVQQEQLKELGDGMLDLLQRLPQPPLAWPEDVKSTLQRLAVRLAYVTRPG